MRTCAADTFFGVGYTPMPMQPTFVLNRQLHALAMTYKKDAGGERLPFVQQQRDENESDSVARSILELRFLWDKGMLSSRQKTR